MEIPFRPIRVLIAKAGLDGHDRGAKIIVRALREAGMEVFYTGLRNTPESIVQTALEKDVDCIGISILSGAHNTLIPRLITQLKDRNADHILVILGGIIPHADIPALLHAGVSAVFGSGQPLDAIVEHLRNHVNPRKPQSASCRR